MRPFKTKSKKKGGVLSLKALGGFKKLAFYSLPYVFVLTLMGALFGGVVAYAMNSPLFELTEVRMRNIGTFTPEQAFKFCELQKGENLITLDLVNVQQVVKRKHPEFKEVRVKRVLPNRIDVFVKRRTPVAQIAFSQYLQIDKDMILLPGTAKTPFKNLMIVEGTPVPRGGPVIGLQIKNAATLRAVRLAEVIKRSNILRKHTLTKFDIRDPKNMSFYVDGFIEIKIGDSHLIERLKILDQTLKTLELDPARIRYIDLRFDDVILGPR